MKTLLLVPPMVLGIVWVGYAQSATNPDAKRLMILLDNSKKAFSLGDVNKARSLSEEALKIDPKSIAARVLLEKSTITVSPNPRPTPFVLRQRLLQEEKRNSMSSDWMHPTYPPKRLHIPDRVNSK